MLFVKFALFVTNKVVFYNTYKDWKKRNRKPSVLIVQDLPSGVDASNQ